jgi:hypothetical protein
MDKHEVRQEIAAMRQTIADLTNQLESLAELLLNQAHGPEDRLAIARTYTDVSLKTLEIPTSVRSVLMRRGIFRIGQLLMLTLKEVDSIPGIGAIKLGVILQRLELHRLALYPESDGAHAFGRWVCYSKPTLNRGELAWLRLNGICCRADLERAELDELKTLDWMTNEIFQVLCQKRGEIAIAPN